MKKVTIVFDFESQSMDVSVNDARECVTPVPADLQSAGSYYKDLQSDWLLLVLLTTRRNGLSELQILIVYFGGLQITPKHRNH